MNTTYDYGWGTLIVAGGGAYYFAKRSINEDRARKADLDAQKRLAQYQLEQAYSQSPPTPKPTPSNMPAYAGKPYTPPAPKSVTSELGKKRGVMGEDKDWHTAHDEAGNPSQEANSDPAPTRHAPEDEAQKMREKSKYEASDVYRSRKGDRFS
ncbi:hypothetical protein SLS60_008573 [Paraconiothyrium brasiliense]|uniref:Uncharacterized protein n=1 Tax=Paraconiothyrium brasiliense TaxID=300254 RepID=A0ABR3QXV3_9PLEO